MGGLNWQCLANQLSRDLYYLSTIAQSRSELLGDIRRNLEHKKVLAEDAKARKQELDKIEAQQLQRKGELEAERKKRQALLSELSHKVKNQRQEIGNLQRDEKQFSTDPATCEMYWKVRKGTFPSVGAMRKTGTTVRAWPDAR